MSWIQINSWFHKCKQTKYKQNVLENLVKKDIYLEMISGNDIRKRLDISFDVTAVSMQFGQQKFQWPQHFEQEVNTQENLAFNCS